MPPANARDTGPTPGLGRFHVLWRSYIPVATTTEPDAATPEAFAFTACGDHRSEKPTHCSEQSPHQSRLETACIQQQRHSATKKQ